MLYQYQLDITDCLVLLIPLVIGVALLINSIRLIKSKRKKDKWNSFIDGVKQNIILQIEELSD